jgi:1-acyl-sn-glycerol-3-phosphate acyltransferase
MLNRLPAPVTGAVMSLFLLVNTVFWVIPVYLVILLKLLTPKGALWNRLSRATAWLAQQWAHCNVLFAGALLDMRWRIDNHAEFNASGQYLVSANHQSWNDIFVLMKTFGRKAPFFKFFIKQELIWVPLLGLAWWGLDYPFMKRYSKEQIEKNPGLKGKDLETTRKACSRYHGQPVLILNFLEGTRFTRAKHEKQQSPYRHLLRPKAGGFAFTLSAMGGELHSLLDVTIAYPGGARGFWDFLCGRVREVAVDVRPVTIPPDLFTGDYENDPVFRKRFQDWVAELWAEKDRRLGEMLARS